MGCFSSSRSGGTFVAAAAEGAAGAAAAGAAAEAWMFHHNCDCDYHDSFMELS